MAATKWRWLALACVVAVAAGVRCWRLDVPVLSHDEAFSWRLTLYAPGELCVRTGLDVHPPLYYLVLKTWTGVFGDAAWALRGLSVVLGLAAVAVGYVLSLEASRWAPWPRLRGDADDGVTVRDAGREHAHAKPRAWHPAHGAALLVALLTALSAGQIEAARNARMYALGVALAGASAWLLLRAMRANDIRWSWWAAYGVAAAAFCFTHNYAFFTLFGQGLFVLAVVCSRWCDQRAHEPLTACAAPSAITVASDHVRVAPSRIQILTGFGYATLLAVILYYPWMRVLLEQMRQVKESYWMQQVTWPILEETLFTWASGLPYEGELVARIWLGIVALAMAFALWRCPRPALFFLLQAWCPVALAVGLSLASGRSVFHDHLLVFGQFFLICFWGVVWAALPGWPERAALDIALVGAALAGVAANLERLPDQAPAVAEAAGYLAEHAQPGDEVWTGSAWELNQMRYYLGQAGAGDVKVRCRHSFPGKGHMVHIASISAEEVIWSESEDQRPPPKRLWVTGHALGAGRGMRFVEQREFRGGGPTVMLSLYEANAGSE